MKLSGTTYKIGFPKKIIIFLVWILLLFRRSVADKIITLNYNFPQMY